MPTALITGANKGIGFATARALAQRDIHVWLGARSPERGREAVAQLHADGLAADFVALDVTDQNSIETAVATVTQSGRGLDILINNAGIMNEVLDSTLTRTVKPSAIPPAQLRAVFDTNLFGAIAVTQAFLPLLRKSPAGRIVNVGSRLGSLGLMSDENWPPRNLALMGYGSSKAALNLATICFAIELQDTPIKVNAVSPGTIATDLSGAPKEVLAQRPDHGRPEDGGELIARYALISDDGPTGRFFGPDGETPW